MDDLVEQTEKASNKLLHLTSTLASALRNEEDLSVDGPAVDKICPWTNAFALTNTVRLNFDAKDAKGTPVTPEGILKQVLLSSGSSSTVTAAAGIIKSACGIVGMAGVGKTVALQRLAHDKDVRFRFSDGIFFMCDSRTCEDLGDDRREIHCRSHWKLYLLTRRCGLRHALV